MLLKERQLAQDTYSRRENLKFEGIPEESYGKNDQTITRKRNLFRDELGIEEASDMKFKDAIEWATNLIDLSLEMSL